MAAKKIAPAQVRRDFNDLAAVTHYARAAHFLGLWDSERILIERFFPDRELRLLEAGCGAGRATLGLWHLGYHRLTAFDFAAEPLAQARDLARDHGATLIQFHLADATRLRTLAGSPWSELRAGRMPLYEGVIFAFNGLMQIPGRRRRRLALRSLHAISRRGARFLFTTHDRDSSPAEQALWRGEAERWAQGRQDPRLVEFGDRYFSDENGNTFMHLPNRAEILADLAATGWAHRFDALRREVAAETRAVRDFSDECRFWLAENAG
ncbi:MAG TPA: class I SAM-dependent methyltransferase [Opitutaceae bacterium]|jgi:SAM-dependent methyltransferase|nr:class I SAM-dependent methyltransferase [Opitutaceae bacterium]